LARIVLTTFGSYGDVFPYLAVAEGLLRRGHDVVVATSELYRDVVGESGAAFAPVRPDVDYDDPEAFARALHRVHGPEVLVRELLVPHLRESYADLTAACVGADLLVSHVLTYAAPILAEKNGLPWVSTVLSPMVFCSAHDPPALAPIPWFASLRGLGPGVVGALWKVLKRFAWRWSAPIRELRRELGLPADADPLWEGQHSPHRVLALFSAEIAQRQPDWPAQTTQCGFAVHDRDFGGGPDDERLQAFLAAGEAPVTLSLGSAATHIAEGLHATVAEAVSRSGRRAVFVMGGAPAPEGLPDCVLTIRTTRVSALFSASAIVVHSGGIGTTGSAMRAGRPQLVIPFAHDQFDNARRVVQAGLGATINRRGLRAGRLSRAIENVLSDERVRATAAAVGERVRAEDGVAAACEEIERLLD